MMLVLKRNHEWLSAFRIRFPTVEAWCHTSLNALEALELLPEHIDAIDDRLDLTTLPDNNRAYPPHVPDACTLTRVACTRSQTAHRPQPARPPSQVAHVRAAPAPRSSLVTHGHGCAGGAADAPDSRAVFASKSRHVCGLANIGVQPFGCLVLLKLLNEATVEAGTVEEVQRFLEGPCVAASPLLEGKSIAASLKKVRLGGAACPLAAHDGLVCVLH